MKWKIPKFVRSFYFLTGLFFIIWILFIDFNDVVTQAQLQKKIYDLESRKDYYRKNIDEISAKYDLRENNIEHIEKYAREQYFMKKEKEDLFVVVEE